jgi:hypothetical protein
MAHFMDELLAAVSDLISRPVTQSMDDHVRQIIPAKWYLPGTIRVRLRCANREATP